MGIFDSADTNAKGTEGGVYYLPGNYVAEVERCKEGVTRKGIAFFVAETRVVKSDNPERPEGCRVSYMVQVTPDPDQKKMAEGNIMDFLRAGFAAKLLKEGGVRMEPNDIPLSKEMCKDAVGEKNELVGVRVSLYAFNKKTKEGNDFTRTKWGVPV